MDRAISTCIVIIIVEEEGENISTFRETCCRLLEDCMIYNVARLFVLIFCF